MGDDRNCGDAAGCAEQHCYQFAGLRIYSQIPLPEWHPFLRSSLDSEPDIRISFEDNLAGVTCAEGSDIITATEYQSYVSGVGRFSVRNGNEIKVSLLPNTSLRQVRPWLMSTLLGVLCYQRGLFFIHASSILTEHGAILLCAHAKGGKSTLASQLNKVGYPLVSDDLCHIEIPIDGPPMVYRSSPRVKLWEDALGKLGWESRPMVPDHARIGKFHLEQVKTIETEAVQVRGIVLLEWGEFEVRLLEGFTALRRFLSAATYRPRLMASEHQVTHHAAASVRLLQRVPVWELRRPRDLESLPATTDRLLAHLAAVV
jgi:hypothetical protein